MALQEYHGNYLYLLMGRLTIWKLALLVCDNTQVNSFFSTFFSLLILFFRQHSCVCFWNTGSMYSKCDLDILRLVKLSK